MIILDPSRGGIGIRLNTPYAILICIKINKNDDIYNISKLVLNLNKIEEIIASIKFVNGPAILTSTVPNFLFLKLNGFIGTGLAQPILKIITDISPIISICFSGLSVSRPLCCAVLSPKHFAVNPWAYSCSVRDIIPASAMVK